jgi:cytochrome b6-f complex iron-sulfur subunit
MFDEGKQPEPPAAPGVSNRSDEVSAGRRWLLKLLLGSSLAAWLVAVLYPILEFVLPPPVAQAVADAIVAAQTNELAPNTGKIFHSFRNRPGLLIRLPDGTYRAFTAVCTHLHCTVQFRPKQEDIWCPCHNGTYDLHGRNVSGPPPKPLEEYDVHVQGEKIVVTHHESS